MKRQAPRGPGLRRKAGLFTLLQLALAQAWAGPVSLSQSPLFLATAAKANVMMMFGNSNSMDTEPSGKAAGSDSPKSKSEIARGAIKGVIETYQDAINMGLMGYQQNALKLWHLHDSWYDVSYNPADHDPTFTGARNSKTKRFMVDNPVTPADKVAFNVNLPFYSSSAQGSAFCYSATACTSPSPDHNFKGSSTNACVPYKSRDDELAQPGDVYACYKRKTGKVNGPFGPDTGYGDKQGDYRFTPTDSDLGQNITDFGKQMAWQYVGRAWFHDDSPGKGYVHVPIALLNGEHSKLINAKLATTRLVDGEKGTTATVPLQNGGLSPLSGTVATAKDYFNGVSLPAELGGAVAMPTSVCSKNFLITLTDGLPSVTMAGKRSSDTDAMLTALKDQVGLLKESKAKVTTYVVGFALPYGVSPTQLDQIAEAGGSGDAYRADDRDTLNTAFSNIFKDIAQKTAAGAAVALNSQSVPEGAHVYQAKFDPIHWSGQLLDFPIDPVTGKLAAVPAWDAAKRLAAMDPDQRVILTTNLTLKAGVAFRWPANAARPGRTEIDATLITALDTSSGGTLDKQGSLRMAYLRGSSANEGDKAPQFRRRLGEKLGDMVNSSPHYVGAPSANYRAPGYAAFRSAQLARRKMLYIGANDGMLHGFDAATGEEKLAYVPSAVFGNLSRLTDQGYVHRFFVDGSPTSGDAFYNKDWHTVLVSGLGAGGRGIVALDITRPDNFSDTNAGSIVRFEFTEKDDPAVGHISGAASIVKLNDGRWAAVFGNGYNGGGDGQSTLFVVDIETGALIRKLQTGIGSAANPNALAAPLVIDTDNNLTADTVYAGDLSGSMWKFDLSAADPKDWTVAYRLYLAPEPITTAPDAGEHPRGGYLVLFGSGKYVESSDITSKPINAMYGVWDRGAEVTDGLLAQTLTEIGVVEGRKYRTASKNKINWSIHKGWVVQMPNIAERIVSDPVLRGGRVIFTSIIPSGDVCSAGGRSWLNEVEWLSGGQLDKPPFDSNLDGQVDSGDLLAEGVSTGETIMSGPAIQKSPVTGLENKFFNESSGAISSVTESTGAKRARRLSWRQVK